MGSVTFNLRPAACGAGVSEEDSTSQPRSLDHSEANLNHQPAMQFSWHWYDMVWSGQNTISQPLQPQISGQDRGWIQACLTMYAVPLRSLWWKRQVEDACSEHFSCLRTVGPQVLNHKPSKKSGRLNLLVLSCS